jgi:hypothetical protein
MWAMITIKATGTGEISFGARTAAPDVAYSSDDIGFTLNGSEEGDQVEGEGDAEIRKDGSIQITFSYHNGDEAILTAQRDTSSRACEREDGSYQVRASVTFPIG